MKRLMGILLATILTFSTALTGAAATNASSGTADTGTQITAASSTEGKTLVAYFSHTGNTESLAKIIQAQVGGDLVELIPETAYPTEYQATVDVARRELDNQARPKLTTTISDMASYDTIYIGYPIWWSTIPMPVATFLESYDFSGKTVIPFCTHAGSGIANSATDIAKLVPSATVPTGLAVSGSSASGAQSTVSTWLQEQTRTGTEITITAGDTVITGALNNTQTSRDIAAALPLTINARDWKEKAYFGRISADVSTSGTQHNQLKAQDLVYWIDGKALMLYYNEDINSNITTPVITVGSITSDLSVFDSLDDTVEIRIDVKR